MIFRIEDSKWIKGCPTYFLILQNIHKLYFDLMLCGVDDFEKAEDIIYLLSVQINRILPSKYKKGTKDLVINFNDGILLLKDTILFLEEDYNKLFDLNESVLTTLSDIRNKYEHEPHNIMAISYIIGDKEQLLSYTYKKYDRMFLDTYSDEIQQKIKDGKIKLKWEINSTQIGKVIIGLNNIFEKIQKMYINASNDYKGLETYRIFQKIINMEFNEINKSIKYYIR